MAEADPSFSQNSLYTANESVSQVGLAPNVALVLLAVVGGLVALGILFRCGWLLYIRSLLLVGKSVFEHARTGDYLNTETNGSFMVVKCYY